MKIFLVRHGEADSEIEGVPLTNKGILGAKSVAGALKKYNFEKIYSSDLLRVKQTCEEFTKNYIEDSRLGEVYRVLIGGPIKEGTSEGRETRDKKRADEFFEELLKKNGDPLIFCHGNLIRYYLNKVLKSKENLWESMTINNCSISILEFKDNLLEIKEVNLINHLPKEILEEISNSGKKEVYLY
jgi:serine/threonine-protein phosphatase PGAM5